MQYELRLPTSDTDETPAVHRVWDQALRLFHWSLAGSVATALVTGMVLGAPWLRLHIAASLLATGLVLARIVWGFFGPTYARFAQFLPRYRDVIAHIRQTDGGRHIGHNPLGALMVFALIGSVLLLAATGTVLLGGLKVGPLASAVTSAAALPVQELHEALAAFVLTLIALHLGGILFESRRSRENLARSMVTGTKPARPGDHISPPKPARPILSLSIVGVGLLAAAGAGARLSQRSADLPPAAALSRTYDEECSACHMAYPPSLRPAASWRLLMSRLDAHFGEDASLPADTTAEITGWLVANAADTVDSKPAALWRSLRETDPVALPDTPAWRELHERVDPALFSGKPVFSRSNCAACHRDATAGWFSPFSISLPKEQ